MWSHCEHDEVDPRDVLDDEEYADYLNSRRERIRTGRAHYTGRVRDEQAE